jgi:hypothetical protein
VTLLRNGFAIVDFDLFMTTGPDPIECGLAVMSPGLC